MTDSSEQLMLMPSTSTAIKKRKVREVPKIDRTDFKLGKTLGRGAFGTAYHGIWDNYAVAIKEVLNVNNDPSFAIEAKQLSRLRNTNIIRLFATVVENEKLKYMIIEFADGGTLSRFLHCNFKPIYSELQGRNWALQCAQGVEYLHKMKPVPLLHRDLKPENLLLKDDYRKLKICDFGTATELKSKMTNDIGTMAYMAPEAFGTVYNEKCDVYSWAILLWEIEARQKPFKHLETEFAIMLSKLEGKRLPDIESCPQPIMQLMKDCWHKSPELRPTMEEVVTQMVVHGSLPDWPSEVAVKNYVPSIHTFDWIEIENLELIDWYCISNVFRGELNKKKVTIMQYPSVDSTGNLIWLQQNLPLNHKNIISVFGILEKPQSAILDSGDIINLHRFLHGSVKVEYSRAHALSWAHQCAEGMVYLYTIEPKPFISCALNPQNLYLTLGGLQLKIGDLGVFLAFMEEDWTIVYDAPEISEGFGSNEKSDVYSWAIVLWEILTRQKPFDDYEIEEVVSRTIAGERPAIEEDWPEPVKKLMQKCWENETKARPTMESVARQMAPYDVETLSAFISPSDLERMYLPIPMIRVADLDEPTSNERRLNGEFKCKIMKWKQQRVFLIELKVGWTMDHFYKWKYPFHLRHPNIVSMFGMIKEQNRAVLEYSENGFLHWFLHSDNQTSYSKSHAMSWAQQFAEGCAYLVAKDVKLFPTFTSELLLSNKCRTLKKIPVPFFYRKEVRIAAAYIAPEFFMKYIINEKMIVYSWAIVLWEMLTRQKPFDGFCKNEIKSKAMAGDRPQIREDWPDAIKLLMANCWDCNPEKRPKIQEVASNMIKIILDFPGSNKPIEYEPDWNSLSVSENLSDADEIVVKIDFDNDETDDETEYETDFEMDDETDDETDCDTDDETLNITDLQ